jgi:ABC-2 type transport system permease protein
VIGLVLLAAFLHLPAYAVIGRFADLHALPRHAGTDRHHGDDFPGLGLMLSQAIEIGDEGVLRPRDLDLIMSSPVKLTNIFSVRIAAIALSVTGMALLFSTPSSMFS